MSRRIPVAFFTIPILCGVLHAQAIEAKFHEPAGSFDDRFGCQVLWHDDVLFVAETGADLAGQVHVFSEQPQGWVEVTAFAPAEALPGLQFGGALAASGDVLVVGSAPTVSTYEPPGPGGAWIFVRDRMGTPTPLDDHWTELQALQPTDPLPPEKYGWSVAVCGDRALVGAPAGGWNAPGAVYVFVRDCGGTSSLLDDVWIQQARLDPSPLSPNSSVGTSVAFLDGGALALASDPWDKDGVDGGLLTWSRDTHRTSDPLDDTWVSGPQIEAQVGAALLGTFVVDGGQILAEAYHPFEQLESIDVFERVADVWSLVQVIDNPEPWLGTFGGRLAAAGDWMVSGSMRFVDMPTGFGADAMIFHRVDGLWTLVTTTKAPDQSQLDRFGWGLSIAGSRIFLGTPGGPSGDDWPPVEGAVYVLVADAPNGWGHYPHEYGEPALAGWGLLDGAHAVTVRAYDSWGSLGPPMPAMLVIGFSLLDVPLLGHTLVPHPDVLVPIVLGANDDVMLTGHWPADLPAGSSVWFQVWLPLPSWWIPPGWAVSTGLVVTQPTP